MPTVIRVPIKSNQTEESPRPWFNLDWDGANIQVGPGNSCFGLAQKGNHPRPINLGAVQTYEGDLNDADGNPYNQMQWVFCMLMDGEFAFVPVSALPSVTVKGALMAHLGVYNPVTDELRLWEFIEIGS